VRDGHPTEKPLELYKWLIERYCPADGTLLDPTAGSFNSCFAGYELNRNCIGIEKDDKFYKKACDRADALSEVS
jgi:site-specific DNA-methyltransferase (adenine-specific)